MLLFFSKAAKLVLARVSKSSESNNFLFFFWENYKNYLNGCLQKNVYFIGILTNLTMLSFLLLIRKTMDWSQFQSEVSVIPACELCMLVSQNLRENTSFALIPENGTECANPKTENKYCQAIANITKDIKEHFGNKIPRSACGIIGPCVPSSIPDFTGEFCYPCRFLQALANDAKTRKKSTFIKNFCTTSRNVFSGFCQKIEEDSRPNNFYAVIDSFKSNTPGAVCSNYCRKKGKTHSSSGSRTPKGGKEDL